MTHTATISADHPFDDKIAQWTLDDKRSNDKQLFFQCHGAWTVRYLGELTQTLSAQIDHISTHNPPQSIQISGQMLKGFDSAGALLLWQAIEQLHLKLKLPKSDIQCIDFSSSQMELFDLVQEQSNATQSIAQEDIKRSSEDFLEFIGHETIQKMHQFDGLIQLVGNLTDKIFRGFGQWKKFQVPSIISIINSAGLKALPIIALLSFLIGVVLAYQMGLQLETYGANMYIAYLSGMAIFREFGPLITAIIVAGRTSSSFTAQIGSMKLNEEIDALKTMGLSPIELLALPKVLGLILVFPLIIFWSDVFSVMGSMIMSKFMLHIGYIEFLNRLKIDVGADQLMLGLYKAPAFALLIALVGCFQGFQVEHNADSIGSQTTRSVVQALFLIIIADAMYSVMYSWMDL